MTLHPVTPAKTGHNRYCGPGALSALTGLDTQEAAKLLRQVSGRRSIKGTRSEYMVMALRSLGYAVAEQLRPATRLSLRRWARQSVQSGRVYLVMVTNHWCVVSGRRYVDNQTLTPVSVKASPSSRKRVRRVWHVEKSLLVHPSTAYELRQTLKAVPKPKNPAYAKARVLAKRHGIQLERDGDIWWVYPPEHAWANGGDPLEGEHVACNWGEVLDKVETYITELSRLGARPSSVEATA